MDKYRHIGISEEKIDSLALATASEKFTDDLPITDPLHCALLYSPLAHAEIVSLDSTAALANPEVVDLLFFENVPPVLHTTAGQGYPEPSPYDTVLFDRRMRFVGDRVALVAAETKAAALEAVRKIRVEYKVLKNLLDYRQAAEPGSPRIHSGDEYAKIPVAYEPEQNLAAEVAFAYGDPERDFDEAEQVEDQSYACQTASHCAIEPHAAAAFFDERGRLVIISTTQVPFHARRIVSRVLDIPLRSIRVIKPRIGGGFGGKQEVLLEPLVALAAWRNKRAAKLVLSRKEVFVATRTRHAMSLRLKTGNRADGEITSMHLDAVMNAGAYGSHALTVLTNTGSKVLPLFNKIENVRFSGRSLYSNTPVGGAYRGYGATQGYFAFNQQIDMIARRSGQDLLEYCKRWHIREGESSAVFKALGEGREGVSQVIGCCKLDECIDRGARSAGWYDLRDKKIQAAPDRFRGVGLAIGMQGSGIPLVDMGAASMKMNEDGSFNLLIGATDIGTGSDTVLAQIAAEVLTVPLNKIIVLSSDTDLTPFDVGAYASSTTYVSGQAVKRCALELRRQILQVAGRLLDRDPDQLVIEQELVHGAGGSSPGESLSLEEIAYSSLYAEQQFQIQGQASFVPEQSPPPFIAQFAEVEVDVQSGRVEVIKFVSALDCGQAINPLLAEGQVEGAVLNGISYALCEDYLYNDSGRMRNPNFWDYKIFTTLDLPELTTILVDAHEESGPFGAKSVGEIAINGPGPAIANAIFDAVGVRLFDMPMTPEKVWRALKV